MTIPMSVLEPGLNLKFTLYEKCMSKGLNSAHMGKTLDP